MVIGGAEPLRSVQITSKLQLAPAMYGGGGARQRPTEFYHGTSLRRSDAPKSEVYDVKSQFGEAKDIHAEPEAWEEPGAAHFVFKEVVVNGAKGWARVESS